MDYLPNIINYVLVVLVGVVLNYVIRERSREQERLVSAQLQGLREVTEARFESMQRQIDGLTVEFAGMRSDLTNVALAVGARTRPQTG